MPALTELADWLRARLGEVTAVRPGPAEVHRLALALDPADLPPHLEADALFLHRHFRLGAAFPALGVLACHDGFDDTLTTGENRTLAARLGWTALRTVRSERAKGLSARPPQENWPELLAALEKEFGGHEAVLEPREPAVSRLAVMNAMRPDLLSAVAAQGVQVYVTGQLRPGAISAARQLGMGVVALGHRRSEVWGLRRLADELETAFPGLACTVYPGA